MPRLQVLGLIHIATTDRTDSAFTSIADIKVLAPIVHKRSHLRFAASSYAYRH